MPATHAEHEFARRAGQLPLDALLVRSGLSSPSTMAHSALIYRGTVGGGYGLTFWSWPDLDAAQISERVRAEAESRCSKNPVVHPQLRSTSVRALLLANEGFRLEKSGGPGHYTLHLPIDVPNTVICVTAEDLLLSDNEQVFAAIDGALGVPQVNPGRGVIDDRKP
jgi:hypothetical protein